MRTAALTCGWRIYLPKLSMEDLLAALKIYRRKELAKIIDLTEDTVTADKIISGFKAHTADGKVVVGTLFEGYPEEQTFFCAMHDSDGNVVTDSFGNVIKTRVVYRRSDSSGDGFVYRRV